MGKSGALFLLEDKTVKCPSLSVKAHSTVGAGDAMVAGLAYSWDERLSGEDGGFRRRGHHHWNEAAGKRAGEYAEGTGDH